MQGEPSFNSVVQYAHIIEKISNGFEIVSDFKMALLESLTTVEPLPKQLLDMIVNLHE